MNASNLFSLKHNFLLIILLYTLQKFSLMSINLQYVENHALLWLAKALEITYFKENIWGFCPGSKKGENYIQV